MAGRVEVYLDGGVRKGTDVLKALAMGAKAVFVGRPILWGLVYDGHRGVERVLEILRDELVLAMKLSGESILLVLFLRSENQCLLALFHSGCTSLADIRSELVVHETYYTLPRPRL